MDKKTVDLIGDLLMVAVGFIATELVLKATEDYKQQVRRLDQIEADLHWVRQDNAKRFAESQAKRETPNKPRTRNLKAADFEDKHPGA